MYLELKDLKKAIESPVLTQGFDTKYCMTNEVQLRLNIELLYVRPTGLKTITKMLSVST